MIVDGFNANGQINPDQMIALETAIPHVAEHFEYLQADELQKETYQQLWPIFSEIVSIAGVDYEETGATGKQPASARRRSPDRGS